MSSTETADIRRASLADLRTVDFRAASRDPWTDELAMWDRLLACWAGLDEAAWHLPGAAPSDAGGPDWSLAEHVGHIADWQELAVDYVSAARATGAWPTDDDFDGGDFDGFNERLRAPWTSRSSADIVDRLSAVRPRLVEATRAFSPDELRGDDPWGWVYMTLHGHYLDHLTLLEPWCDGLRARQADGDPFVDDPRPPSHEAFRADDAAITTRLDALVGAIPFAQWDDGELTPGWTLRDHVGHLADWAIEGRHAVEVFERDGVWLADPDEGIDAWNERHVAASRGETAEATLARYHAARAAMLEAVGRLRIEDLRSPDGWSWAYDCLHGHVRKHLALIGPWAARVGWPREAST
jgi:DinB superfamily/Mycothiol maleylpyruvate isomerase N-terminal domain